MEVNFVAYACPGVLITVHAVKLQGIMGNKGLTLLNQEISVDVSIGWAIS